MFPTHIDVGVEALGSEGRAPWEFRAKAAAHSPQVKSMRAVESARFVQRTAQVGMEATTAGLPRGIPMAQWGHNLAE